jgi:hypothetical protein
VYSGHAGLDHGMAQNFIFPGYVVVGFHELCAVSRAVRKVVLGY